MTGWVEMLVTMADGPKQPVQGVVVPYRHSDERWRFSYGSYGEDPVLPRLRPGGVRLYRWGRQSRIESMEGDLLFVSDGDTAWFFTSDPHRPRCTALRNVQFKGPGRELVITRPVSHWVGDHHARPTGPVTDLDCLGRRCWSVDLAPRESRAMPRPSLRLVVDADSGAVLEQHSGDGVTGAAFADVTVGSPIDPALFTWDGPVVTDLESRALAGKGPSHQWDESMQWFRENITAEPIRVPVLMDFTPPLVDLTDRESGAFSAPLGPNLCGGHSAGWLIRRLRSKEPWKVKTHGYQVAWSTEDFDWACHISRGTLDAAAIAVLQQQLHPGDPVVGTPELVFGGSDGP
ncbi:MAG: hypothetical protein WAW17_19755 [Rhodococcus sp. (in: high G+C Gram-positive bacteria)]|uniref:hypothetical protein n=1 Tax=Rhodococcus sp. TaxID=1831 RepID=UPI003BB1CCF4